MPLLEQTTGLILAGGAGRRMGDRDKGLLVWRGKPLIEHVVHRLRPQVGSLLISCNRNRDYYDSLCDTTFGDRRSGYAGPLAGLEAAAPVVTTPFVVIAPCDTPLLPADLAARLLTALVDTGGEGAQVTYVHDGEREQYLCAAMRASLLQSLGADLDSGVRAVKQWYGRHRCVVVDFSSQRERFKNVNALD